MAIPPTNTATQTLGIPTTQYEPPVSASNAPPLQPAAKSDKARDSKEGIPSPSELQDAVERISNFVAQNNSDITFSIDSDTGRNLVKVIDRNSKEIIRQIPSVEVLAISKALDKLQGLLINQKS